MDNQIYTPNPESHNQPPITMKSTSTSSSKSIFPLLALSLLLIISVSANLLQYLGYIDNIKGIYKYLPAWTNIPQVKDYGFYYYIETTLQELRNVSGQNLPGNIEVVTEIQGPGLPKFYLGQDTDIFVTDNNSFKKVGREQLKPGQRIGILFNYYRLQEWGLPRITILP